MSEKWTTVALTSDDEGEGAVRVKEVLHGKHTEIWFGTYDELAAILKRHATREEPGQEIVTFDQWFVEKYGSTRDPIALKSMKDAWKTSRKFALASLGTTERTQPRICGKPTKWHLIAGYSQYACMKPRDHDGECLPGGTCMKHGTYVGFSDGIVRCPKWPDCIDWTILVTKPEAGRTPETGR